MPLSAMFAVKTLTYQLILVNLLVHANDAFEELSRIISNSEHNSEPSNLLHKIYGII